MQKKFYSICLGSLIILNCLMFYLFSGTGNIKALLFSIIILFMVLFIFKDRVNIFSNVYIVISIIMVIDLLYFDYFNEFPSIKIIKESVMLTNVKDSVFFLISLKYFLVIIDALLLKILVKKFILKKNEGAKESQVKTLKNKNTIIICCILVAVFTIFQFNPMEAEAITQINHTEFFAYHVNDLVSIFKTNDYEPYTVEQFKKDIKNNHKNEEIPQDDFYGIGKNKNLIVIQVESLQNFPINKKYNGQELTPNINKLLKKDSIYFNNYYQQLGKGNTSDAEFVSLNSMYPVIYGPSYSQFQNNTFYGLPWIMKEQGYNTSLFHGYRADFWNRENMYKQQGFEQFISEKDFKLNEIVGLGLSDEEFFKQSIAYIKELKQPFYNSMITLSCHHPYQFDEKYMNIKLKPKHKGTLFGNYLQGAYYSDKAIGLFIDKLKENGLYDNTVIVIYGDHFGLNCRDSENKKYMTDYLGHNYDYDDMFNIPLIIHVPDSNITVTKDITGGQIDFLPTMLHIFGLNNQSLFTMGQDLFTAKNGFVASQTYMTKGSFIADDIVFEMSRDGIYNNSRAWNKRTRDAVDLKACRKYYEKAIKDIEKSYVVLENNMFESINSDDYKLNKLEPQFFVAHAGGKLKDCTYTNCKEAFDNSKNNNLKFLEADIQWTEDNKLVLFHSWDGFLTKFFNVEPKRYNYDEFKDFKMINDWHQMTVDDLMKWLKENEDIYIVTDVKEKNVEALKYISDNYKELIDRVIPQIYYMDEYISVRYLGFKNIVYTLYKSSNKNAEIVDFAKHNKLLAITMPVARAETGLGLDLDEINVFSYCHTINNYDDIEDLKKLGIDGFYTDELY